MKKIPAVMISFILIIATAITIFNGCGKKEVNTVKIGADFTLTGNTAFWSEELKKGMDLVAEENKSDSMKIEIIYEDNQGKASEAVNIFKKFATIDKVNIVISCFTPISQAIRDLPPSYKIPFLATVTSVSSFSTNDWTFRDFVTQDQQATALAKYSFENMKLKKGSYLVVNDDYGLDGASIFKKVFQALGGTFIDGETFNQNDVNIRNQATRVLNKKPEFILLIGRDQSLVNAFKQLREISPKIAIIGVNSFDTEVVWNGLKENAEGVVFTSSYIDYLNNTLANKFQIDYQNKYGKNPSYVSVYGYTIGKYLFNILQSTGPNNDAIKQKLAHYSENSIRGTLSINENQDVLSPIGIYQRNNGANKLLEKY